MPWCGGPSSLPGPEHRDRRARRRRGAGAAPTLETPAGTPTGATERDGDADRHHVRAPEPVGSMISLPVTTVGDEQSAGTAVDPRSWRGPEGVVGCRLSKGRRLPDSRRPAAGAAARLPGRRCATGRGRPGGATRTRRRRHGRRPGGRRDPVGRHRGRPRAASISACSPSAGAATTRWRHPRPSAVPIRPRLREARAAETCRATARPSSSRSCNGRSSPVTHPTLPRTHW